jgi:uncharacterized repeat protein (TIGR03803 family)
MCAGAHRNTLLSSHHFVLENKRDHLMHGIVKAACRNFVLSAVLTGATFFADRAFAQTYKVLYTFGNSAGDGFAAYGALARDTAGNLYGTTPYGGAGGFGTVYRLSRDGTETILYTFRGGDDGANPVGGLKLDQSGNIFGAASNAGNASCNKVGCGVVFEIGPDGTETILHAFVGGTDGAEPDGPITLDNSGNIFGTTLNGGSTLCKGIGCGTVFKISPDGTETVLYAFRGGNSDGEGPVSNLVLDRMGNFYGTTAFGGGLCHKSGCGTVFKLAATGEESILQFFNGENGSYPGSLVAGGNGNLYGSAGGGLKGKKCHGGCGVVFEVAKSGGVSIVHAFSGSEGAYPAGLFVGRSGYIFGTAVEGGSKDEGTIFKLAPDGTETTLYSFAGGALGGFPAGVVADKKENLYGTTMEGGDLQCNSDIGCGLIFELKNK